MASENNPIHVVIQWTLKQKNRNFRFGFSLQRGWDLLIFLMWLKTRLRRAFILSDTSTDTSLYEVNYSKF